MARDEEGFYYILNVLRVRETPSEVEKLVKQTAMIYGNDRCDYWMEQEPGSSGVNTIDYYRRKVLAGFYFQEEKTTGKKADRARPFSSMAEAGNIRLVKARWNNDFLDELSIFPTEDAHDDQVDAASLAFSKCVGKLFGSAYEAKPPPKPQAADYENTEEQEVTNQFGLSIARSPLSGYKFSKP
jgi:predicted phage terminase large subunit-like protein